jgi:hypothetical protein
MNVLNYPSTPFKTQQNGFLSNDWSYFLSMNTQEQQRYFSNDGHLVPTRTNTDLVGNGSSNTGLSTSQYTARFAYNGDTNNHMANVAGQYKNLTMNLLSTRSQIISMTPMGNRIEQYADENKLLYTNVNGTMYQNLTIATTYPMNFSTNGTLLNSSINGTNYNVPTAAAAIPLQFTSSDGSYLYLTIAGNPFKIPIST